MAKLRLGPVETDKPVRVSIKLPAPVYRNLLAYAEALAKTDNLIHKATGCLASQLQLTINLF